MAPVLGDGGMGDLQARECNHQARGKSFLDVSKCQRCWICISGSTCGEQSRAQIETSPFDRYGNLLRCQRH